MNPVFDERCSYIENSATVGIWYSTNCSDEHQVICKNEFYDGVFLRPNPSMTTNVIPVSDAVFTPASLNISYRNDSNSGT